MNGIDRHRYAMLVRVKQFGISHAKLFPAETLDGRLFAALAAAVDQATRFLTEHVRERTAARSGTRSKAAARVALLAGLGAFARMANAFAADVPGLEGRFRRPSSDVNDLELLTVGRAFIADAAPLAPHLVEHGLPLTSLADVQAALEAFEGAALGRLAAHAARASSRAGLTAALGAAGQALARLDVIVPNTLRAQPALLAAWKVARHVQRAAATRQATPALRPQPQPQAASEPMRLVASAVIRPDAGERPSDVRERPSAVGDRSVPSHNSQQERRLSGGDPREFDWRVSRAAGRLPRAPSVVH